MNKFAALGIIFFVILLMAFTIWKLFHGNIEAAFMPLPFLIIIYFFVNSKMKK